MFEGGWDNTRLDAAELPGSWTGDSFKVSRLAFSEATLGRGYTGIRLPMRDTLYL